MCSSHQCAGYVKDVSMEIKSAFFPPPTIVMPTLEIPPLKTYVYEFAIERQAVQYYDKETRRRNAIAEGEGQQSASEADRATPSTSAQPTDSGPVSPAVGGLANDPSVVAPPPRPPIPVLTPEPASAKTAGAESQRDLLSASSSSAATSGGLSNGGSGSDAARPVKFHGFEEFEATTTLFDLMELKSLDDRKELEKLLM